MKPNKTRNHSRQISLLALALALSLALTACQAADPGMAPAPPESKVPAQSAPVGATTPDTNLFRPRPPDPKCRAGPSMTGQKTRCPKTHRRPPGSTRPRKSP